ncbi:hypothetical protein Vc3S01_0620 [Vibrio campbellii]|nr:hypothetical protein Vc3S01_0620 [Vibrio campbellii]
MAFRFNHHRSLLKNNTVHYTKNIKKDKNKSMSDQCHRETNQYLTTTYKTKANN